MPDFSIDLAVVIGIDDYSDTVGRLRTPVEDAKVIADLLASRFGYSVILFCDSAAGLKGLRQLLHADLRVPEGSRLLFYFAGHGQASDGPELEGPRGSLVPHGGTADVETHLSMDELYKALTGLPCRHLLVILDCCFAGSFRWAGRRPLYAPGDLLYEERYRHWVRHPAHWFLSSAAHDQYALDTLDRRRGRSDLHSPFAAAVLDGLKGKADLLPPGGDGVVTLAELYTYVQDRLSPHQTPLLSQLPGQTRGEYVFRAPGRPLPSAQSVVLTRETNPYRGLKPYRAEHAELFFGRGTAARRLLRHVRTHGLTVVLGPSGSGKSSLVQAGLLPRLRRWTGRGTRPAAGWKVLLPLRVTADPFFDLNKTLAAAGGPPPPSVEELRRDARTLTAWAAAWRAAHPCERLLLFLDQAEELVTRVPRSGAEASGEIPVAAAGLLAGLAALLRGGEGRLRVLLTLRSDFEPDLDEGPLTGLWKTGRFLVPALAREELREAVEGPAARKALYFDDPRMVERLVDEVVGMPGGLPLLSYALSQLYLAYIVESRGDRLLTAADFAKIGGDAELDGPGAAGGIVRVLRKAADDAVRSLPDDAHRETLWLVLLRMVNLVGVRPTRRQVPASELDYPDPAENRRRDEVLARLVDARLLVKDAGVVEPAHDELLVAWPQLAGQIEAAKVRLPVHRRLSETAVEWSTAGRRRRDLDLRLLGLVETAGLPTAWLNRAESEYVTEARQERRRRIARRWTLAAAILLAAIGAAIFFRYQSQIARSRELAALALATDHRDRGLLLAEAAYRVKPTLEARSSLLRLLSTLRHVDLFLHGQPPGVRTVAFSPDGRLIAAGGDGGRITVWDLEKPGRPRWSLTPPQSPTGSWNEVHALEFANNGREVVAAYEWGGVRIWDLSTSAGRPLAGWPRSSPETRRVSSNWFGADPEPPEQRGERPATALDLDRLNGQAVAGDFSGRLFGLDLPTSTVLWTMQLDTSAIESLALVQGADLVVVADGAGRLLSVLTGTREVRRFAGQQDPKRLVLLRYLLKEERLLSLDLDGRLVHWRREGADFSLDKQFVLPLRPLAAELGLAKDRVLVASHGAEIRSFSLETGAELAEGALVGHRLPALAVRCSGTRRRCASGGAGGEVVVWDPERAHPLVETVREVEDLVTFRHGAGGDLQVLTQTGDRISWSSLGSAEGPRELPTGDMTGIGVQDGGEEMVLGFPDGRVILFEEPASHEGTLLERAGPEPEPIDSFAVSSRFVAGVNRMSDRLFLWRREQPTAPLLELRFDEPIHTLRFSPDERLLVAGSGRGRLMRWDLTLTRPALKSHKVSDGPISALTFSQDGGQLFTGSGFQRSDAGENLTEADRRIRLWNPWSLELVRELPERHTDSVSEILVSPDSQLLVSGGADGEVVLWDTSTWREVGSLPHGVGTAVYGMAFDRGATRLVTASDDRLLTWRIADEDLLAEACRLANRTIAPGEWEQSVGDSRPQTGCGGVP